MAEETGLIHKLKNQIALTSGKVESVSKKQSTLINDIQKLNMKYASILEEEKNHITRKVECQDKCSDLRVRIQSIKEKFAVARGLLQALKEN